MPHDSFYWSTAWRKTAAYVRERDRHRCTRCGAPAKEVDHIVPRGVPGGSDHPSNLRLLCNRCHAGARRNRDGTRPLKPMCDRDGMPTDPSHPWFRKKKQ